MSSSSSKRPLSPSKKQSSPGKKQGSYRKRHRDYPIILILVGVIVVLFSVYHSHTCIQADGNEPFLKHNNESPDKHRMAIKKLESELEVLRRERDSYIIKEYKEKTSGAKNNNDNTNNNIGGVRTAHHANLTLLAGEMPGYTGWARPTTTLAHWFRIVGTSSNRPVAGKNWTVTVACSHAECRKGRSLFYVRAYGRALLPGRVANHNNGTYGITILPFDSGVYQVEVVLTFSVAPSFEVLPLPGKRGEPGYEGYLLPGFPVEVTVVQRPPNNGYFGKELDQAVDNGQQQEEEGSKSNNFVQQPVRYCTAAELLETGPSSAVETGRWLVTEKNTERAWYRNPNLTHFANEHISQQGYQHSLNSMAFKADYFYNDCTVMSLDHVKDPKTWRNAIDAGELVGGSKNNKRKPLVIYFIGDSNTREQYNYFRDNIQPSLKKGGVNRVQITYVDLMGYWPEKFPAIREKLRNLGKQAEHRFVVFNIGLHEFTHYCALHGQAQGHKYEGPDSCFPVYLNHTRTLVETVKKELPAQFHVWQSTTAGWPKWGVYGLAWPIAGAQKFPRETNFCGYANDKVWPIVTKDYGLRVMDTYWLTLSRVDHREVKDKEEIRTSYKLVHLGPEVYLFLIRKISMLVLEAMMKGKEDVAYF